MRRGRSGPLCLAQHATANAQRLVEQGAPQPQQHAAAVVQPRRLRLAPKLQEATRAKEVAEEAALV